MHTSMVCRLTIKLSEHRELVFVKIDNSLQSPQKEKKRVRDITQLTSK